LKSAYALLELAIKDIVGNSMKVGLQEVVFFLGACRYVRELLSAFKLLLKQWKHVYVSREQTNLYSLMTFMALPSDQVQGKDQTIMYI
jgi:hypothetical protein